MRTGTTEGGHDHYADCPQRARWRARRGLARGVPVMAPPESWPLVYQIRVRGRLGETMRSAFPALRAHAEDGDTVLTGVLADQAALYGVLAEAEGLGLELIEVRRLPPGEPWEPAS